MRGKLVAVLTLTAMLAGGGTTAPHTAAPAAQRGAPAAQPARAPVGSRAAALALARQMLSRLVVPAGAQAADPSPEPRPLILSSSAGGVSPYTVELHRFVQVQSPR